VTETDKPTMTMTMGAAPTERVKAGARLIRASFINAMAALKQYAGGLEILADVNDLSFRRDGGSVDVSAVLEIPGQEQALKDLEAAAIAFAEADRAEKDGTRKDAPTGMLNVSCAECNDAVQVPFPIERDMLFRHLACKRWFLSVMTPPGQGKETPIVLGALCPRCAKRVLPPEVLKTAEKMRDEVSRS
jgi:hypothetical protein